MSNDSEGPLSQPVVVRIPVEPVEAAMEADALDAAVRHESLAVRGPLFGIATRCEEDGPRWRVAVPIIHGCPQQARDSLNSLLWFRAKDDAKDVAERRALLAAVSRLEREYVNELTVLGTRFRVVRAEEYAGMDARGNIELPRPTDPDPLDGGWEPGVSDPLDLDLVLDMDAPISPLQAAERLAMRSLAYTGSRFPADVRGDSARAVETHPDVLLLPASFIVVERSGKKNWRPGGSLHTTAHAARSALYNGLTWMEPRLLGLIPFDAPGGVDAYSVIAEGTSPVADRLAEFTGAADRLRAGRLNEVEAHGTTYRIVRSRRLLRWGPEGPEGPRPSDVNTQTPMVMHPPLDENGVIQPESE
ncbi:DUF5954 family protein [Streptomyces sp. NPDC059783]|uniref:DUF5954 family protein n=1 Tax=Streptomyces sp. NPDC059783 TaxID=3346944 RepID=UPI00364ADC9D